MMHEADLTEIEMFCNKRLEFLVPPYKDPQQKLRVEIMGRHIKETTAEERQKSKDECRKYYIAGGANPDSLDFDYNRLLEIAKIRREKGAKQIEDQTLFACSGRKPINRYRKLM